MCSREVLADISGASHGPSSFTTWLVLILTGSTTSIVCHAYCGRAPGLNMAHEGHGNPSRHQVRPVNGS